ncbi:DUF6362 family protein, partial [Rhizorhabdus sp.]|uniref:DUF6362 family protein n=1 Tax=Rhizorhabdus sp. TaxID=1968843 RepID=UPI0025CC6D0D
ASTNSAPPRSNAWPEAAGERGTNLPSGTSATTPRKPLPSPRMITEAEEAMLWLRWLEKDDAQIVWLRANRTPWKKICWEVGLSRPAANRHWQYGIAVITWRLNGRAPSAKRSRRFVVENADRLSRKIVM